MPAFFLTAIDGKGAPYEKATASPEGDSVVEAKVPVATRPAAMAVTAVVAAIAIARLAAITAIAVVAAMTVTAEAIATAIQPPVAVTAVAAAIAMTVTAEIAILAEMHVRHVHLNPSIVRIPFVEFLQLYRFQEIKMTHEQRRCPVCLYLLEELTMTECPFCQTHVDVDNFSFKRVCYHPTCPNGVCWTTDECFLCHCHAYDYEKDYRSYRYLTCLSFEGKIIASGICCRRCLDKRQRLLPYSNYEATDDDVRRFGMENA